MKARLWLQGPELKLNDEGEAERENEGVALSVCSAEAALAVRDARERATTLAHPERELPAGGAQAYNEARAEGVRTFVLWADRHRQRVHARVVTASAGKRRTATYEVLDAAGDLLAVITRTPALTAGLRTRWTVRPAHGSAATGRKGRLFGWVLWWLLVPLQSVLVIAMVLSGSSQGDLVRMPRRVRWRAGGTKVLDWSSGRGGSLNDQLAVSDDTHWDSRVTAALVCLLESHGGVWAGSWDAGSADSPPPER